MMVDGCGDNGGGNVPIADMLKPTTPYTAIDWASGKLG